MIRKSLFVLIGLLIQTMLISGQSPSQKSSAAFYKSEIFIRSLQKKIFGYGNAPVYAAQNNALSYNQLKNCGASNLFLTPEAVGCNGVSVTQVSFDNAIRTRVSGTNNTVGVKYKYANAGTAPDGVKVDAFVTVLAYSNNQDTNQSNFTDADTTSSGFDQNIQPDINQESAVFTGASFWKGSIRYLIEFYVAGSTTQRKSLTVAATSIDNDGSNGRICGANLRESVTYSGVTSPILINTFANTNQVVNGNTVLGPAENQENIGTGSNFANAALLQNINSFEWTYSFETTTPTTCAAGTTSLSRLGSLNLTCQIDFDQDFGFMISGNVFNDTNGLTETPTGIVNGTGTNAGGLFANLIGSNNLIVDSIAVAADGTYSFPRAEQGSYTIQISTIKGVAGSLPPAKVLPSGWVNTGEFLGAGAGNDGTVNGILPITVGLANVTNANFGIEQRPTAGSSSVASQVNPGGTNRVTIPSTTFTTADTAPGTVSSIRITGLPTNATSIRINGTLYGTGGTTFPTAGVTVPVNVSGNPTQTIEVDPVNGAVSVVVPYVAVDNAGVASLAAAVTVPFNLTISGNVLNDVNGLTDSTVNGSGITITGLFANLISGGVVVQRVAIPTGGAYSFTISGAENYSVQISTTQGVINSAPPAVTLPQNWVNTGENIGTGAGNDGSVNPALKADGLLAVTVSTLSISNANFGIEERPTASNKTAPTQQNLGGTTNGTVPPTTFSASDITPGTVSSIRITAFPSNATSITINGTKCTSANLAALTSLIIPTDGSGNPTQTILADPIDGEVMVGIPYNAIDDAGVESSAAATASVPFVLAPTAATVEISGTLYFGGTALRNTLVSLTDSSTGKTFYTRTNRNGRYLFEQEVGKTYTVTPLSSKYSFNPSTKLINLLGSVEDADFSSSAKNYHPKNDFDGDGKSDIAVFRPSDGNWYILASSENAMRVYRFGQDGDIPVSADFDGDGKTDIAVFRPSEGIWYIQHSGDGGFRAEFFGYGDDKLVPADYDGDGRADIAVYRNGFWYILNSSDRSFTARHFGASEDIPVAQDFDGDGKTDLMVYRPSDGNWYMIGSRNNAFSAGRFGISTDIPVAADYDGDGRADIAQFRNGNWYIQNSATGLENIVLGSETTKTIVGDYDGDGRADTTVFKDGMWFVRNSESGIITEILFGLPTDILVK